MGRRLLARFLIAALLPISGLGFYSYQVVGEILIESAHRQLTRDGKAYGMSLVESLNRLAATLQMAVERNNGFPAAAPAGFSALGIGQAVAPPASDGSEVYRLALAADSDPVLIAPLPSSDLPLLARIDAERFWNNDSAPEYFCVFAVSGERLHCSSGMSAIDGSILPPSHIDRNTVVSERRLEGTEYLLGFWYARYLPTLNSPGFIVMVATPKAMALEQLAQFRVAFPAVVLLAIALAAGFSVGQIRRQMEPLVKLRQSTRRLSAGDLKARSEVASDDEFGQLGRAFDRMATHLESKFHMLGLLSEIDQAILGAAERGALAENLLRHIHLALPCDGAGLILVGKHGDGELIGRWSDQATDTASRRVSLSADNLAALPSGAEWFVLPTERLPATCIQALSAQHIACLLAFPALLDSRLDSLLLLAFAQPPERREEIVQAGRSLADRLAIAASSVAREQLLQHRAHYDSLTGLPNRLLLRDRIAQAIAHAHRTGTCAALLFIDLDGFKQVNDSLGHEKGDLLLVEYADRLRQRMRESDTVGRLGGDEFVVLIADLTRETAYAIVDRMARDLNRILAEPVALADHKVVSPASIGIALYPDHALDHDELLRMADEAMYASKRRDSGGYCFYDSHISAQTRDRFELTQELRHAIKQGQLLLYYQPKVDARDGSLSGAEALLRWRSPKRGLVAPGVFLHLLDEMGLGTWLGEWVLDQACAQMREWDRQGLAPFPVSINFSPLQFERTPVLERVKATLSRHGLAPERLEVEILESMAANESPNVRENLIQLRELGVRIALDDFGTGFSSLVHLTQVPADIVKLDRVFIHSLCSEPRQRQLVELIIAMARVMDLKVVAEGVENEAQRQLLPALGCDLLQGYLIGYPIAPEAFADQWMKAAAPS